LKSPFGLIPTPAADSAKNGASELSQTGSETLSSPPWPW
jgi:hypothetical protein